MLMDNPHVSIIIPVRNAARYLPNCLKNLKELNYPKDRYEVIIADSNSTDGTRKIALDMGAKVVSVLGNSVCAGRNAGFKIAAGDIIAFSDADCVMDRDWILNSLKYFKDGSVCCVGGPSLVPEDETPFGKACGFVFSHRVFTGGSSYGRSFKGATEVSGNPGCNAIYLKSALSRVMPVDEKFLEAEDAFMNQRLREMGYRFLHTPDTKLWHYRSSTPRRFWRQNFRYAMGRVFLGRHNRLLLNPLHYAAGLSLLFIPLILLGAFLADVRIFGLIIKTGAALLLISALWGWTGTKSWRTGLNVPLAIIMLTASWSLGFMRQLFFEKELRR